MALDPSCWAPCAGRRNILALTGDPPRVGDNPTGTGVWDVDSIGLIEILARPTGARTRRAPPSASARRSRSLRPGPHRARRRHGWDRLERKIAAGADHVLTQPLYDVPQTRLSSPSAPAASVPAASPVLVLLASCRCLDAPRRSLTTRSRHHDPDAAGPGCATRRAAPRRLEMADALLSHVEREVAGTYLMPSFGRYEQAAELVRRIRARHPAAGTTGS